MARRLGLPVTEQRGAAALTPTVDRIRKQLGGRVSTEFEAGDIVELLAADGATRMPGVVLFGSERDRDVLVSGGRVHRTGPERVTPHAGPVPDELAQAARDAARFSRLAEGEAVRYQDPRTGPGGGQLIEKCRYGALVLRADQTVLGVGFKSIFPSGNDAPLDETERAGGE